MKLGIIGGGTVGQATARAFIEHVEEVVIYDKDPLRCTGGDKTVVSDCDLIFLCLPTPQKPNSLECDTSALHEELAHFDTNYDQLRQRNLVIKSTVPIGTTRALSKQYNLPSLIHSPEFLTARCAVTDAQIPARNIVGYPTRCDEAVYNACGVKLINLYKSRWPHVPIFAMSSDESEAVKLFQNSFFAVKVAFFNEMYTLSEKLGLDWRVVIDGILADGRIAPSHTKVPGSDLLFGFGGTCLPKDLANIIHTLNTNDLSAHVTSAAYNRNLVDREREI